MNRRWMSLLIALMILAAFTTIGSAEVPAASPAVLEGLREAIAEQPALLTSVGQSADVEMIKVMMTRNGLQFTAKNLAVPDDIGEHKTLVLAIGGSTKGLGAAGIDADQELLRVSGLLAAAKEKGLVIIAMHIGGSARRGDLSDRFIPPCFEAADYALIVADGDQDGYMAGLALKAGIPMDTVGNMTEAIAPLKAAFK